VVYGDRRVVATIGLTDMVVVDTPDATLVCPKSRAQDVKRIVEHSQTAGRSGASGASDRPSTLGLLHGPRRRAGLQGKASHGQRRRPAVVTTPPQA
jgi:hypothetical protein